MVRSGSYLGFRCTIMAEEECTLTLFYLHDQGMIVIRPLDIQFETGFLDNKDTVISEVYNVSSVRSECLYIFVFPMIPVIVHCRYKQVNLVEMHAFF